MMDERTVTKLWREAIDAGDYKMSAICVSALGGNESAVAEVARVIEEAQEAAR